MNESLGGLTIETLLQVSLVLVNSITDKHGVNILVIDQDKISSQKGPAHYCHVVGESFTPVSSILIHELTDRKFKQFLHFALLVELKEHRLHPPEEDIRPSNYLEVVAHAKSDAQYQSSILHTLSREVIAQLSFELGEKNKVLAHVSIKHAVNDQLPHVSLSFNRNVFEQIGIIPIEHYLKCSGQVMHFKYQAVTVSNSKRMFCSNYKLVCISWMLIIMDKVCNKACKNIIKLKIAL